jgi:protein-tyrosine phosphatase
MATSKEEADKIHLMTDYLVQFRKLHDHIPDPYYGEASGFELVLDLLEDACEGLLLSIKRDHLLI